MLAVLGLWPAKYLGLIAFFAVLSRRIEPFGERRLSSALAARDAGKRSDGLEAGAAMLDAVAGRQLFSRRYLGAVVVFTLASYPLVFLYALSWSDAMRALFLTGRDDGGARASVIVQLGLFWLMFGPPATLFAMGACQALADVIGWRLRPSRYRPLAFALAGALSTVAVLWLLYFATVVLAGPQDGAGLAVDIDRATSSLAYALSFELTAGIYAYAAFLPLALALFAIIAARLPRNGTRIPTVWRPAVPALVATAIADILLGFG